MGEERGAVVSAIAPFFLAHCAALYGHKKAPCSDAGTGGFLRPIAFGLSP